MKKQQELTSDQKAVMLMEREVKRAVDRVKLLEQLYLKTLKEKELTK